MERYLTFISIICTGERSLAVLAHALYEKVNPWPGGHGARRSIEGTNGMKQLVILSGKGRDR